MTREEAIAVLKQGTMFNPTLENKDYPKAFDMAIKALEYDDAKYHEEHGEVVVDKAVWEDAKKALEQEPCEEYKRGWHDAIATALKETHNYYTEDGVFSAIQEESLIGVGMSMQEPKTDYKSFCEWVANEIFAEDWEYNKDAFAEIACRKLAKLGIVRAKGDEWVLVEPQERSDKECTKKI